MAAAGGHLGGLRLPDSIRAMMSTRAEAGEGSAAPPQAKQPERAPAARPDSDTRRETPATPERPARSGADDPLVYVTTTGATYHAAGCRELGDDRLSLPLSDARASYGPCSICRPPV